MVRAYRSAGRSAGCWTVGRRPRGLQKRASACRWQPLVEESSARGGYSRTGARGAGRLLAARAAGQSTTPIGRRASTSWPRSSPTCQVRRFDVPVDLRADPDEYATSFAILRDYCSNFIEGTEFSVAEAEAIVESEADIPADRRADAHDVLGTFEAVADPESPGAAIRRHGGRVLALLRTPPPGNVMAGRPARRPGRFKDQPNQAGSYVFVAPALSAEH